VFRQLMGDLFSGTQDYTSLKRRLWGIWASRLVNSSRVVEPGSPRQGQRATGRPQQAIEDRCSFRPGRQYSFPNTRASIAGVYFLPLIMGQRDGTQITR